MVGPLHAVSDEWGRRAVHEAGARCTTPLYSRTVRHLCVVCFLFPTLQECWKKKNVRYIFHHPPAPGHGRSVAGTEPMDHAASAARRRRKGAPRDRKTERRGVPTLSGANDDDETQKRSPVTGLPRQRQRQTRVRVPWSGRVTRQLTVHTGVVGRAPTYLPIAPLRGGLHRP